METENRSCKQKKIIYNLAIKRKALNNLNLPQNSSVDKDEDTQSGGTDEKNIFNGEILEKIRDFQSNKEYTIVGKKQVKAYHYRNTKKKGAFKRADSAISNSKQSNTCLSQDTDNNIYLTKEDLLDTIIRNAKDETYPPKKCSILQKVKIRYKKYRALWVDNNQLPEIQNQNRKNIYQIVDNSRQKHEKRELATLREKKENIPANKWKDTLRFRVDLMHYYDREYVEHIMKDGFSLKGNSKKQKQMEWVSNQSNSIFQFFQKKYNFNHSLQEKLTNAEMKIKVPSQK